MELKSVDEYEGMQLFTTRDGTAGFAIAEDGDIVSVFNNTAGPHRQVTPYLISLAVENGGKKLDAFDIGGGLPRLYEAAGFDEVSRASWNPEFAPDDWTEALGTPDVVFMELSK